MTWGSSVPVVVAALTASWTTALGGVAVANGPIVSDDSSMEGVSVGYQDATLPAAEGQFDADAFVSDPMREQYTINCLLTVRDGDNDQVAAQARVWAILGLIGGSLAADHRLGGLVLSAHLGTWALTLTQTTVGATARLPFDVVIDAYTTT